MFCTCRETFICVTAILNIDPVCFITRFTTRTKFEYIFLFYTHKLFGICIFLSNGMPFDLIPAFCSLATALKTFMKIIQKCCVFFTSLASTKLSCFRFSTLEPSRNAIQWKLMLKVLRSFSFSFSILVFLFLKKRAHWLIPVTRRIRSIFLPSTYAFQRKYDA